MNSEELQDSDSSNIASRQYDISGDARINFFSALDQILPSEEITITQPVAIKSALNPDDDKKIQDIFKVSARELSEQLLQGDIEYKVEFSSLVKRIMRLYEKHESFRTMIQALERSNLFITSNIKKAIFNFHHAEAALKLVEIEKNLFCPSDQQTEQLSVVFNQEKFNQLYCCHIQSSQGMLDALKRLQSSHALTSISYQAICA